MNTSTKNVNAWILLDEDNPKGSSYKTPLSCYQTLIDYGVYKSIDVLNICFFITLPTTNKTVPVGDGTSYTLQIGNATSVHHDGSTTQQYLNWMISDARKTNPDIKLLATLGYGNNSLNGIFSNDHKTPEQNAIDFANNLLTYLAKYDLDGFDIDWESPVNYSITQKQFAILFTAIRKAFNNQNTKQYYLTLSPASVGNLDAPTINNSFDFVTLQLYSGFTFKRDFINAGINKNLLAYGAKFESTGAGNPAPFQDAQNADQGFKEGSYNILTQWRMNSGNYQFEQAQQMILSDLIKGVSGNEFNDGSIIAAAGNPPITHMQVRAGDVLNAIQCTNTGTFSNVPLKYSLLQHGGDSGNLNTIVIPTNDVITEISGYTGVWFGWKCVLQLTIKTKNGNIFGPFGSMNNATTKSPFSLSDPSGQSVVAFSGTVINVPLQSGEKTDIIANLDVVYASN